MMHQGFHPCQAKSISIKAVVKLLNSDIYQMTYHDGLDAAFYV